jgi:non-specific serine/threonine protein kinase
MRFRMLETVRDYGREKAGERGEHAELRQRHRDWCERLVLDMESQWISSRELALITTLVREHPNLRDALESCVSESPASGLRIVAALYPFWLSRGLLSEGRRWLDRLLAHTPAGPTVDYAKALYVGSMMTGVQGDLQAAAALVKDAHELEGRTREPLARAHIDSALGYSALFGGQPLDARTYLEKAVRTYAGRNDVVEVVALIGLGLADEFLGDTEHAIECYERVLAITDARGESVFRSYCLWGLAVAVWRRGERERAVGLLEQALQADLEVNDRFNASLSLQALAWIAAEDQNARRVQSSSCPI